MADPTFEPSLIAKALDWAWAGVLGLVGILYKNNDKKLCDIDAKIEHEVRCARVEIKGKADESEMRRQRDNIEKLFEGQEKIRQETSAGFVAMQNRMSDTHIVLLNKLNELGIERRSVKR